MSQPPPTPWPESPTAPLDAEQVADALLPFGRSRMLPKDAYLEPAVLSWEQAHVFDGWTCVGRASQVPEGHLHAVSIGKTGLMLTRDLDGTLRAFENACRHRGHELLPEGATATAKAIVCPYHAWTYRLDGSLLGAPGFRDDPGFDCRNYPLNAVRVTEWHGWVFVDGSGTAGDFAGHTGDIEAVVAPYGAERLETVVTHVYEVAANWKVVVENYQECYHCSNIHPELCRVSPPDSGENLDPAGDWVGGWMDLRGGAETMSLDGKSGGVTIQRLGEREQHTVMYAVVLPNLLVSLHPDYVMSHVLTPIAPDLTRISCSWAFPPEAVALPGFDPAYAVDFWDLTNRQDWAACESVQRGMRTPSYQPGPLAPAEDGVYQFVTWMARRYLGTAG
jgi:Rieske 2Fe-2S family protein